MQRLAPNVVGWVQRMMEPGIVSGEFLADDQVPDTLLPVLRRLMRELLPVVNGTMRALDEWAAANPDEVEPPRGIGTHAFVLEAGLPNEVTAQRAIQPFLQWMWQRPWDAFAALSSGQQQDVLTLLDRVNGRDAFAQAPATRLVRRNFKLQIENRG